METISIPVSELVVGDLLELKQGDRVPADCFLLEEEELSVDETKHDLDRI